MKFVYLQLGALLATGLFVSEAHAHFKLLKPASWVKEDSQGNPQKISPCGVAKGDTSAAVTKAVTTYKAGETISVEWQDTIAHPGYFRIALAANRDDLKDPTVKQGADCSYDEKLTPKEATGNVLADGIDFRSRTGFSDKAGKMFSHQITLPEEPCDNCTLQVMQVMENDIQAISNCYYLHCADIKIVAADGETSKDAGASESPKDASTSSVSDASTAVKDSGAKPVVRDAGGESMSGGSSDQGGSDDGDEPATTGNTKDAGKGTKKDASTGSSSADDDDPAPAKANDGCSVARGNTSGALWFLLGMAALLVRRRRINT